MLIELTEMLQETPHEKMTTLTEQSLLSSARHSERSTGVPLVVDEKCRESQSALLSVLHTHTHTPQVLLPPRCEELLLHVHISIA